MKKCKTCIYKDLLPIADPCFSCTKDIQDGYERDCTEEGTCEKCKTCVYEDEYPEDPPCCDCDPFTDAKGFEPCGKSCNDCIYSDLVVIAEPCHSCNGSNKFEPKENKSGKNK